MEEKARNLSLDAETLYSDLVNLTSLLLAVGDALENEDNLYGYRQESCALFRQPHKPAVRCGYPSSRVTSR